MNYSEYAFHKITINKYKGKTFEELANEIMTNDKNYINIMTKQLNTSKTPLDKKNEIQNFLNYFFNFFEPNYVPNEVLPTPPPTTSLWFAPVHNIPFTHKITHIIHISDIHIRLYNRNKEYLDVFEKLYQFIEQQISSNKNQIIIITGDLLHSKNNLSPECIITTQNFLIKLASYTTTLLIAGNHDALLTNSQREDSITAIIEKVNLPNFYYLKNSAIYNISNLAIAVNSLLDNKWINANTFTLDKNMTHKIALYHGPVGLCDTGVGHRLRGEKLIEDFDGYDYVLLGDIHKFQFLDPEQKRIGYASSLIAQNFNEWNSPHGVLHWDLFTQNHQYYPIENECGFFVFNLMDNNIFIENEQISINNIPEYVNKTSMNIKLNIQNCSTEFVSKINFSIKQSCQDVKINHNYLGTKTKETQPEINIDSNSLLSEYIQKNYPNIQQDDMNTILQKYQEYSNEIQINSEQNLSRWELVDLEFSNLFGYGPDNFIDFSRFSSENPIGIIAPNSHGKSSIIDIILLTLFTKFSRSRGTGVSKDIINVNSSNFSSKLRFKIGSDIYIIIKEGKRELSDKIKITKNEFYKQKDNIVTLLTDEDRKKTDKIITELIGTYDDFVFTNIQFQNRNNSFKEMTDKERKEYLYKVLKLNIWADVAKKISESTKPLKNSISYLEKSIENKSVDEIIEKTQEIGIEIENVQDKIEQQLHEKQINYEVLNQERDKLIKDCLAEKYDENEINSFKKSLTKIGTQINNIQNKINGLLSQSFELISEKDEIITQFNKEKGIVEKKIGKLEGKLSKLKIQALIPTNNLWNKLPYKKDTPEKILEIIKSSKNIIPELKQNLDEKNNVFNELSQKVSEMKEVFQNLQNEKIINENRIHIIKEEVVFSELKNTFKLKSREREIVQKKINNFKSELENEIYVKWKEEIPLQLNLVQKQQEEKDLLKIIRELDSHEYDPKCKFCVKHPIVKQKQEKKEELKKVQNELESLKKKIVVQNPQEIEKNFNETKEKLSEKEKKILSLDSILMKMEMQLEKLEQNEKVTQIIQELSCKINEISPELSQSEKNLKKLGKEKDLLQQELVQKEQENMKLNQYQEIILDIIEIDSKNKLIENENKIIEDINEEIRELDEEFEESEINMKYLKLKEEMDNELKTKLEISDFKNEMQRLEYEKINIEKIIHEIDNSKENLLFNQKIRNNISIMQSKIDKNESLIAKFNEKLGILYQQQIDIINQEKLFKSQLDELRQKRNEYKLMQILEQSLGKDGLPLIILQNYLVPITQSINNIISPFISRIIKLHVDNEDLILDSFPDSNSRSVYIHGGMESFILDIAFKITLSNFAKLPKCDILFLDEGISAFDNERLSNIDILFNFIKRYFSKTILITHIESVKESIQEKIGIIKENNLSKIICEYII